MAEGLGKWVEAGERVSRRVEKTKEKLREGENERQIMTRPEKCELVPQVVDGLRCRRERK